jgi:hypothetical protein
LLRIGQPINSALEGLFLHFGMLFFWLLNDGGGLDRFGTFYFIGPYSDYSVIKIIGRFIRAEVMA